MSKYTQEELEDEYSFVHNEETRAKLSCPYCGNYSFPILSIEMIEDFIKDKIGSQCTKCGKIREYNRQNVSYVPNPHFIKKED
jgi:uncharacterized OB-fold protein